MRVFPPDDTNPATNRDLRRWTQQLLAVLILNVFLIFMLSWGYVIVRNDEGDIRASFTHADLVTCEKSVEGRAAFRDFVQFAFHLPGTPPPTEEALKVEQQLLARIPPLTCPVGGS